MYQYEPLPPIAAFGLTPPFTRILHLDPGSSVEHPFCGQLEIVNVEAAPSYEALSYTWGIDDPSNYIWLQGSPLPIRPNLEAALHSLRLPDKTRRLWIDALCIDQSNLEERQRQVLYMRLVYKHCARVIAWLGHKSPGTELAFEAGRRLSTVGQVIRESSAGLQSGAQGQLSGAFVADLVQHAVQDLPPSSLQHLTDLFDRDYFHRTWVIQEVFVGSSPVAKCENLEIPLFDLVSCLLFLGTRRGSIKMATSLDIWYSVSSRRNVESAVQSTDISGSLGPLMDLLENMRSFKATDPRDKIFSVLGICDEGCQPIQTLTHITRSTDRLLAPFTQAVTGAQNLINSLIPQSPIGIPAALKPDYSKSTVAVYCDTARFFIRKSPMFLDVLSYVQHHSDPSTGEYPSWVPRWYEGRTFHVFRGENCSAGICMPPASDIFQQPRIPRALAHPLRLTLDGFRVGVVQSVSDVIQFDGGGVSKVVALQRIWSSLFAFPLVPRPTNTYRNGEPLDTAFCRAVTASPNGIMYAAMASASAAGLSVNQPNLSREGLESLVQRCVTSFLSELAQQHGVHSPFPSANFEDATTFRNGFGWYSYNRRAFLTREGHIGLGPMVLQPGDEVVVLFRGKMPYILRQQPDHHIFVGDCYIRDDDIMLGRTTENVRHGRGGPTVYTFELR